MKTCISTSSGTSMMRVIKFSSPSCSAVTGVNIKALADLISSLVHSDGKEGKEKASKKKKICCF